MPVRRTWGNWRAVALAFVVGLACAPTASADPGGYASHSWPGCDGGFNSGSWDDDGLVYVPCGNPSTIGVYDESGALVRSIPVDGFVSDVAPTRDGRYLYLAGSGAPRRLARVSDGSYALDEFWSAARYPIWGTTYAPGGHFVATDAAGNVYYADGTWGANLTHTVVKYDSQGRFVTRFGEWANTWSLGTFYWALGGVAVSGDGSTVYTVELGNNRVQRWDRQVSGAYTVRDSFGSTDANNADRGGYCDYVGWRGTLAAPYDVALDGDDNLYVINTTCKQVLKFAPDFGALLANLDVRVDGGDYPRPHGFAVGRDGTVYVGENQRALRPSGGSAPAAAPTSLLPPDPPPQPTAPDVLPTTTPIVIDPRPERPADAGQGGAPSREPPGIRDTSIGPATLRRAGRRATITVPVTCVVRCRVELTVRRSGRLTSRRVTWLRPGPPSTLAAPAGEARSRGAATVSIRVSDTSARIATWRRRAR